MTYDMNIKDWGSLQNKHNWTALKKCLFVHNRLTLIWKFFLYFFFFFFFLSLEIWQNCSKYLYQLYAISSLRCLQVSGLLQSAITSLRCLQISGLYWMYGWKKGPSPSVSYIILFDEICLCQTCKETDHTCMWALALGYNFMLTQMSWVIMGEHRDT